MAFITSAKSQFDTLPIELVHEILSYAMVRDNPFDLGDCIRTAKHLDTSVISENPRIVSLIEADRSRRYKADGEKSSFQRRLYKASIETQQQHLQDWHVAGSVCSRVRRIGKEAFFSNKVFAMDLPLAKRLQARSLSRLSTEDQQTALKHITSILLIVDNPQSPSAFISLPRCIAGFPKLTCLDFFLVGSLKADPLSSMIEAAKTRLQPPSEFYEALTAIGMPTDKIAMGISINPDTKWSSYARSLESNIYPMLRAWATMKFGKEAEKVDG